MKLFTALQIVAAIAVATVTLADEAVPKAVIDAFVKKYPGAKAEKWEVDKNGYWEAKFSNSGVSNRADFLKSGQWIETETSLKFTDLPEAVQESVKRDFPNGEISEIESVDHASRGKFFDVEFKQKGPNKDVEYRKNGERVN